MLVLFVSCFLRASAFAWSFTKQGLEPFQRFTKPSIQPPSVQPRPTELTLGRSPGFVKRNLPLGGLASGTHCWTIANHFRLCSRALDPRELSRDNGRSFLRRELLGFTTRPARFSTNRATTRLVPNQKTGLRPVPFRSIKDSP